MQIKVGMRVKLKEDLNKRMQGVPLIISEIKQDMIYLLNVGWFHVSLIDWEETRKLNEDYGLKADFIFIDEEPKKSFFVVYNEPNGQKKHNTYEEALEEAKSKFSKSPNAKLCIMECKAEISGKINIDIKELI